MSDSYFDTVIDYEKPKSQKPFEDHPDALARRDALMNSQQRTSAEAAPAANANLIEDPSA